MANALLIDPVAQFIQRVSLICLSFLHKGHGRYTFNVLRSNGLYDVGFEKFVNSVAEIFTLCFHELMLVWNLLWEPCIQWCSAPSMGITSLSDSTKQSVNLDSSSHTLFCCSSDKSEPIETCLRISATDCGLCGSVVCVKIE